MRLKKILKDPFVLLIAAVVLVPALLIAYAITHQNRPQSAVNGVSQQTAQAQDSSTSSSNTTASNRPDTQKPITQAEQQAPVAERAPTQAAALAPGPVCDQAKKQAALASRDSQLAQENSHHERQLDRIRLISKIYRRYWDEEMARHQNAINQIEATFQAALAAANC